MAARAVLHPLHQLAQVRTRGSRQDIASVTGTMKVVVSQASISLRREPHSAAEGSVLHRAPARAREQQAVVLRPGGSREVGAIIDYEAASCDSSGGSRHDALVDEDQRRDLLRRAEDEVRRVSREHGRDSPRARAERQRQLGLERSTAAELGLPYAERVDLGVRWDAGTPMPVLLSGLRTFVAFYLGVHDPVFDRTNPRVRDPHADHGIGVVEFKRVTSIKIGFSDDEVLRGHPLWGSGLEFYSAHEVKNSPWITELMEADRAQERFDESQWTGRHHFMLTFHDETLECVAKWTITRTAPGATMPEVLARLSAEAV